MSLPNASVVTGVCETYKQGGPRVLGSVSNVDDAGDLAQRGTVPQLSGRCLLAVDGMSGAEYEGGLRRAVKNGMQE